MRKAITTFLLALLAISSAVTAARAAYVPDEVVAKFKPYIGFRVQAFVGESLGLKQQRMVFSSDYAVFGVPDGSTPEKVIAQLKSSPFVLSAERNPIAHLTAVPNDPSFRNQWSLQTPTAGNFGINLPDALSFSVGAGIVVAVVDTGAAYENFGPYTINPDLDPRRIRSGWDFANEDSHPDDDSNFGHGTFMCSLVGATTNNGFSGAGIAPGCILMPIKSFDANGQGTADRIASGVVYASRFGARVILIGGATVERSQCLQDAIDQAYTQGALVIAGAGNDGANLDGSPSVQQVYNHVMYVGATAKDGSLAPYSNHGSFLSVVAPGGASDTEGPLASDYSPYDASVPAFGFRPDGTSIQSMSGTSVAAAHAAGVAALVLGQNGNLVPSAVRAQIESTARHLGDAHLYGAGLVDAAAAVGAPTTATPGGTGGGSGGAGSGGGVISPPEVIDAAVTGLTVPSSPVTVGNSATINVGVQNDGSKAKTVTVTLRDVTTGQTIATQNVALSSGQTRTVAFSWTATVPAAAHTLRATVSLTGDQNPFDDTSTAQVTIKPVTLQVKITPSQTSYRVGQWIGINFAATDGGQPAGGANISFSVVGATGAVIEQGSATTDAKGQMSIVISRYFAAGGYGTYTVQATGSRKGVTTTAQQTFSVLSSRGSY